MAKFTIAHKLYLLRQDRRRLEAAGQPPEYDFIVPAVSDVTVDYQYTFPSPWPVPAPPLTYPVPAELADGLPSVTSQPATFWFWSYSGFAPESFTSHFPAPLEDANAFPGEALPGPMFTSDGGDMEAIAWYVQLGGGAVAQTEVDALSLDPPAFVDASPIELILCDPQSAIGNTPSDDNIVYTDPTRDPDSNGVEVGVVGSGPGDSFDPPRRWLYMVTAASI